MKTLLKTTAAIALAGAIGLASATPGEARGGRVAGALAAGVVAGALVGAAAANSGYYYGDGYYYGPGYYPGYYGPAPYAYDYGYYGPGYSAYGYAPRSGSSPRSYRDSSGSNVTP